MFRIKRIDSRLVPNKNNLFTPSKQNISFVLTESKISHLTKTKKKVQTAVSRLKGSQSSRNFTRIQGVSSRLSEVAKPVRRHKVNDPNAAIIDKTIASLGNLSSRVMMGYEKQQR